MTVVKLVLFAAQFDRLYQPLPFFLLSSWFPSLSYWMTVMAQLMLAGVLASPTVSCLCLSHRTDVGQMRQRKGNVWIHCLHFLYCQGVLLWASFNDSQISHKSRNDLTYSEVDCVIVLHLHDKLLGTPAMNQCTLIQKLCNKSNFYDNENTVYLF